MNEVIEQFKVVFGFDDKPLQDGIKKTESSLKGLGKVFGSLMASFVSFQAIKSITADYMNYNVQLGLNSSLIGANVSELDALGNAMQYFGGDTNSATASLKSLNSHLEQAKFGQGALIEVAKKYGVVVDAYSKPMDALKQLSGQMGKFSDSQRLAIAQQLGLDDSMVRAFGNPDLLNKYIDRMNALGTATEEDVKLADEFSGSITYLKQIFNALTRDFARVILPAFTKLVDLFSSFIEWVRKHKQLVVIFFGMVLIAMSPILIMFGKMAIASAVAFAPVIAIGAVLAGISLVIEDIYGYFMGWDSVTGDLVKEFPILGTILESIKNVVMSIVDVFGKLIDWVKDASWEKFKNLFISIGSIIKDSILAPFDGLMDMMSNIGGMFKSLLPDWAVKLVDKFIGGDTVAPAPAVPMQSSVVNKTQSSNYNVNNNFNQNIQTASPQQFADQTNKQILDSLNNARQSQGAL